MAEESKTGEHGRPEAVKMAKNGGEIFAEIFSDV